MLSVFLRGKAEQKPASILRIPHHTFLFNMCKNLTIIWRVIKWVTVGKFGMMAKLKKRQNCCNDNCYRLSPEIYTRQSQCISCTFFIGNSKEGFWLQVRITYCGSFQSS